MVMVRVHLPVQLQLPVSPFLALEDDGDQGSLGVSVLKWMSLFATKSPRSSVLGIDVIPKTEIKAWGSGVRRTSQSSAAYHRN